MQWFVFRRKLRYSKRMVIVSEVRCNSSCDIAFVCAWNVTGDLFTWRLKVRLRRVGPINATWYMMHTMYWALVAAPECRPLYRQTLTNSSVCVLQSRYAVAAQAKRIVLNEYLVAHSLCSQVICRLSDKCNC